MPENYDLSGVAQLNEKTVAELKATKRAALPFFVFALVLGLIPIIGWFFFGPVLFLMGLWTIVVLSRTHYTLTDKRLSKVALSLEHSVKKSQSLISPTYKSTSQSGVKSSATVRLQ